MYLHTNKHVKRSQVVKKEKRDNESEEERMDGQFVHHPPRFNEFME